MRVSHARASSVVALTCALLLAGGGRTTAAPFTWDASGGAPLDDGSGSWNATGGTNWFNGATYGAWGNQNVDTATFGVSNGTAGTITVGSIITNGITFNSAGSGNYTLSSGTISLAGTTPTITVNASGTTTLTSVLVGTAGLTKTGAGTLLLGTGNTYTGTTTINQGTVQVTGITNTLGNSTNQSVLLNGGALEITGAANVYPTWAITVGASGGTLRNSTGMIWGLGSNQFRGSGTLTLVGNARFTMVNTQNNFSGKWVLDGSTSGFFLDQQSTGSSATALGTATGDDVVSFVNNGQVLLRGGTFGTASQGITISSGSAIVNGGAGSLTHVLPGKISGLGALRLSLGQGNAIVLSNSGNSYSGDTVASTNAGTNPGTLRLGASEVIPDGAGKGTVYLFNGGQTITLDLNGFSETVNGLSSLNPGTSTLSNDSAVDNSVASSSSTLTVGGNDATATFAGVIRNTGASATLALTKIGSGTQTLSNANTYVGATNINAGTLKIGAGSTTGALSTSSAISGSAGATLAFERSNTVTQGTNFASVIGGAINVSQLGSGTLVLNGANTFSGTTRAVAGTLSLSSSSALQNSTLDLNSADNGSVVFGITGTNTYSIGNLIGSRNLTTSGSVVLSVGGNGTSGTYSGVLSGGGALAKLGSGTLTLSGNNTYSGQTRVSAGILALGAANAISNQSNLLVDGGGFNLAGFDDTVSAVTLTSGSIFGAGTLTSGSIYDVQAGTVSAILGGAVGLTKSTSGTVTLSGANTYTGATQVTAGLLRVDAANAISSSSAITLGGSTTRGFLEIAAPLTISSLTFSGSGGDVVDTSQSTATFSAASGPATITVGSGSNVFHAAATLASATLLDISSGAFFTFHNNISGSATFTKQGLGTLNIVGDNDGYSGTFLITGGRVNIGAGMNQIGTGTTTLSGGATLDLGGQAFTDRVVVLSGTILNAGGTATTTTISGPATISGSTVGTYNITSAGIGTFQAAVGNGSLPVNVNVSSTTAPGGQAIFSDVIAGLGNVTVYGGGTATFNGAVSGFTITHGVSTFNAAYNTEAQVQNGGSATFAGTTGPSSVIKVFAGGAGTFSNSVTGTVQVGGTAEFTSTSSLTGSLTTNSGGVATFSNMTATVASTIHNDGQLNVNRTTGSQTISGVINGSGSLVKQGAGSLLLSGNNSYSGGTWIDGGTLTAGHVNAFGSGLITLGSGATLDLANYLVTNAITNNGGTIRGGTISGTVSGTTSLSNGETTFDGTIAAGAQINVASTGTASFGNGATIQAGATIANDGLMLVSRSAASSALTIGGVVSGAGRFQIDSGKASLDAANIYTGNTVISGSGSVLKMGAAGSFATSPMIVVGDASSTAAILDLTAKSGTFTFGSDQTLKGGGTIQLASSGVLNVQGTFSPGNSPGLFTYDGGTTLLSGTTLMEILGTGRATFASHGADPYYDAVDVINGGVLTFGGALQLAITGTYADNTIWNLFTAGAGSSLAGNFSMIAFTGASSYAGLTFTSGTANPKVWTSTSTGGGQSFTFDASVGTLVIVPEPGTIIFAGIGIAMAGWSLWKRRRIARILRHHRHTP